VASNQQRREAAKRKLERQQDRRSQREKRRKRIAAVTAAVVVLAVVGATVAFVAFDSPAKPADTPPADALTHAPLPNLAIPTQLAALPVRAPALPATVSCEYRSDPPASKPVGPPPATGVSARGTVPVSLSSTIGAIDLTLDRALAPCTVNNFISLAQQGYFTGTTCHRLTTSPGLQVLQCGDPTEKGSGGPGYRFADEVFPQLRYGRGLVAMANAGPDTNGSQFFMIYGDAQLPPNYTVFGTIAPATLGLLDKVARDGFVDAAEAGDGDGHPFTAVTFRGAKVG
jgi:peptidyl-prolyl cis-trans isomerase B (cyclophilin B)